jgi:hypothetical protein
LDQTEGHTIDLGSFSRVHNFSCGISSSSCYKSQFPNYSLAVTTMSNILGTQEVPATNIIRHIKGIEAYLVRKYPLGAALCAVQDDIIKAIVSPFAESTRSL